MLNDIASEPLDKFSPPLDKVPDDLESEVSDLQDQYQKAVDIRERVFKSNSPDLSMSNDEFEQYVNKAEKILQELREKIQQEIQMSKQLARKFDLDELLERLDDISKQFVKANTVEDLIEVYLQVMGVYNQIREVIHDTLSSPQEDLLEWFIRKDDDVKLNSEVLRELATDFDCNETEIVEHFLSLQEDGFLDFLVKNPQHG
jgi:Glu-tRNA(Gln) amidotransferase subunit E-like FAD-binding protein